MKIINSVRKNINKTHRVFKVPSLANLSLVVLINFVPTTQHLLPYLLHEFLLNTRNRTKRYLTIYFIHSAPCLGPSGKACKAQLGRVSTIKCYSLCLYPLVLPALLHLVASPPSPLGPVRLALPSGFHGTVLSAPHIPLRRALPWAHGC